ncbi:Uncharacterized damage-inducible protein DinB (forms a four-helix bundle) [Bryocella elongata]|uniref:Uncharacterized damage-inducible protein DinB (Forms a four-helix bundle) n=1 Tax=Bryocella elongata TaxID=863522 RepID=A0A1H5XUU3_9BACT|nr:DinB family protein [Bryocella elongata]SEG15295.1 Uncharacterized damage-inducible protein DinB (forms a four-helix bundle) [Bryocella elongata]
MTTETATVNLVTAEAFLQNWQAHRRLTRKVIAAFPEDQLFTFTLGGMRSFGQMALEMIGMAVPVAAGVGTGKWGGFEYGKPGTKADLLALWDEQTPLLDEAFRAIPPDRFWLVTKAFDQWEMPGMVMLQYSVDNEIHHRGQGYVYLRALGIEPPVFWERD